MNTWTKLGWMSVMSVSLFALAGCAKANAETASVDEARTATVEVQADTQSTADADADNGPGCAESALDSFGQQ